MEKPSELTEFNRLFTTYRIKFIRFAESYTHDTDVAEDFVMESFIYYWENRLRMEHISNIPAYILTMIKNRCLLHLQQEQLHIDATQKLADLALWELSTRISTLEACEPEEIFVSEIETIVHQTLQKLPAKTREIFEASRFGNMSYDLIAQREGMTVKGVEFHISKAIKSLRLALKDYAPVILAFYIC